MKKHLLFLAFLLLIPIKTIAISCIKNDYEANVNVNKNEISVGEEEYISVSSKDFFNLEYFIEDEGIVEINDRGLIRGLAKGETNIKVTINFLQNREVVESCTTTIPIIVSSTLNTLKTLNIKEVPIENFDPNVFNYELTLPYENEIITIEGEAENEFAEVSGLGEKKLNVGLNEFKIMVKSSSKSFLTYTIAIFREEASKDTTLKNLAIESFILNPKFDPSVYNYTLDVSKDVDAIVIKALANDEKAKVSGTGKHTLTTGKNVINITVVGENGDIANYKIEINKNKGSSLLTDLKVEDHELNEKFQSDVFTYYLDVKNKVDTIKIDAKANDNDQIEILSDGHIKVGKNEILIRVTSQDKTTTTYKLVVNRQAKTSIFNSSIFILILFIIFVILIIVTTILIIIFIKRNRQKAPKIKKVKPKNKKKK